LGAGPAQAAAAGALGQRPFAPGAAGVLGLDGEVGDGEALGGEGLPEPRRSAVLDAVAAVAEREFGGLVERTFYTSIYIARRA
jgi:hypothetical protein